MRSIIILILLACVITASGQRSGKALPVHSIHSGFYTTTSGAHAGLFLDYQYYVDEQISYSVKPGVTGLSQNADLTNYFLYLGMNYRFTALRKPVRERPFNSEPYAGFYPLTFEYIDGYTSINNEGDTIKDNRLGFVPSGIIGYTLIFMNRIDLDMHAGVGISIRLSGNGGKSVEPTAFAGISLGVRF